MTLAQLRAKVRYFLDDASSVATGTNQRWTDAELNSYINESYRFYYNELVANSYDSITKTANLALVADDETVTLPEDFYKMRLIYRVEDTTKTPLRYIRNYDGIIDTSGEGSSNYEPAYDFVGNASGVQELVLYPKPTFSDSTGLEAIYWPTMTELSDDTDSPVAGFNSQWHDLIPLRSAMWAKGGREEEDVNNLAAMLKDSEQSFYKNIERMSNARAYVEPFDIDYWGGC